MVLWIINWQEIKIYYHLFIRLVGIQKCLLPQIIDTKDPQIIENEDNSINILILLEWCPSKYMLIKLMSFVGVVVNSILPKSNMCKFSIVTKILINNAFLCVCVCLYYSHIYSWTENKCDELVTCFSESRNNTIFVYNKIKRYFQRKMNTNNYLFTTDTRTIRTTYKRKWIVLLSLETVDKLLNLNGRVVYVSLSFSLCPCIHTHPTLQHDRF